MASRRSPAPSVALGVETVGLVTIPLALVLLPTRWDPLLIAASFGAGAIGGLGLVLFYRAMALDLIGVVAPITAVVAAALPTAVGVVVGGERFRLGQAAGIAAGLVAIVLITSGGRAARAGARRAVLLALVAGATFGVFFIVFHQTSSAGVTAFVAGRAGSASVALTFALSTRVRVVPLAKSMPLVGLAGVLDGVGMTLYMYATFHGLLSISALLTSFYPAFTILCARLVLHERLSTAQAAGAALAVLAVAAIAIS